MKDFKETKAKILAKLSECKGKVEQLEQLLNIDLTDTKEKIDRTRADIEKEQLKIVLFGAFSDGKSTVISVLLGRTDIKIAPEPTTDKIATYEYDDFFIVDTPGLFSEKTEHDELTRKYISEADLIIFTTDAVNPLKQSQHQTIKWILRDLDKLNQTIFVINKIDTTGIDIENKEEFKTICEIKKKTVIDTLNNILGTSDSSYKIVCLSADPYGMGIDHWLSNREEYEKLSNIKELENIIAGIVNENKYALMLAKVKSVLKDIAIENKKEFKEVLDKIQDDIEMLKLNYNELKEEVDSVNKELSKAVGRIKSRLLAYRSELIGEIHGCTDLTCLKMVVVEDIGREGYVLKHKVELIFTEEFEPIYEYLKAAIEVMEKISDFYSTWDETLLSLAKGGIVIGKYAGKALRSMPTTVLREGILRTRNFLKLPIKFKPWQAMKFAKALQALAIVTEVVSDIIDVVGKILFKRKKSELIETIDNLFNELTAQVQEEGLKEAFFPPLLELEKHVSDLEKDIADRETLLANIKQAMATVEGCKWDEFGNKAI